MESLVFQETQDSQDLQAIQAPPGWVLSTICSNMKDLLIMDCLFNIHSARGTWCLRWLQGWMKSPAWLPWFQDTGWEELNSFTFSVLYRCADFECRSRGNRDHVDLQDHLDPQWVNFHMSCSQILFPQNWIYFFLCLGSQWCSGNSRRRWRPRTNGQIALSHLLHLSIILYLQRFFWVFRVNKVTGDQMDRLENLGLMWVQ